MNPSIEDIREVLKIFLDSELQDLRLEIGSVRLAVTKNGAGGISAQPFSSPAPVAAPVSTPAPAAPAMPVAASAPAAAPAKASATPREGLVTVTAPSVGVFYGRPAPDQPPFVQVGSKVAANDPVCLIEVMKLFTSVAAPIQGRIVEILVADSTMVEYGQPLMYIEPA
jgi:acetyl-CoA carboxylase biotin carboxyl carrier protein